MIYFRKFFRLPGPKDLGLSESNGFMGSEFFEQEGVNTWESYYDRMEKEYPTRFFFASTLPCFFVGIWNRISRPITEATYWLKCHTLKSYRYHILDLRQPSKDFCQIDHYRYGWIDTDSRMLYALFNLLNQFVKHEIKNLYLPTEEEIEKEPSLQDQKNLVLEIQQIHYWWNFERKQDHKEASDMLHVWYEAKKSKAGNEEDLYKKYRENEERLENKTDEMIARLMKVRRSLWS